MTEIDKNAVKTWRNLHQPVVPGRLGGRTGRVIKFRQLTLFDHPSAETGAPPFTNAVTGK
jgi:hypothetical protein